MRSPVRTLLSVSRRFLAFACGILLAGFLATLLVRYAPGYGTSEKDLDPRLSQHRIRVENPSPVRMYGDYLSAAWNGDFGMSELFQVPVRQLVNERWEVTLRNAGTGLVIGWLLGMALCLFAVRTPFSSFRVASGFLPGLLLGMPASLTAFAAVFLRLPAGIAVAAVILPRVYRYSFNLLQATDGRTDVLRARASGIPDRRILWNYHLRQNAPQLLALAGVSANVALGASIPIEALCDSPGLGHLAWKGAMGRDLNLVIAVTLLITAVTLATNQLASFFTPAPEEKKI